MVFPMKLIMPIAAAVAILIISGAAYAQTNSAVVVATCGTPPVTYTAGQSYPQTQDTTGKLCAGATITPGGTQDVNIVQTGGVTQLRSAGAVGTGSERIAVGQDTTTIAGSAPGTAGTPSTNVVSVQGVSGGTGLAVSPALVTITDASRSLSTSSATVSAANASRTTLTLQNFDTTINECYSFTGAAVCGAAGTYTLYPGQTAFWPAGSAPRLAVTAIAASGTPVISAYEGQ